MKIILGSASEARKKIMEKMSLEFSVMPSGIDEKAIRSDNPEKLVLLISRAKAEELIKKITKPVILITADQVCSCNGRILEKPKNEEEVWEWTRMYEKYRVDTINGIVLINTETGKSIEKVDISKVWFKPILDDVVEKLIEEGNVYNRAGAFSLEDPLFKPYILKIEGSIDSIEGLPGEMIEKLLKEIKK